MLTQQEARTLAQLTHMIRDDWNEEGIYAALGKVRDRATVAVILATIRAADDPNARTPGVIPTDGPHWRESTPKATVPESPRPPRKDEACPLHPGSYATACHSCRADQLAGDRTTPPELRKPDRGNHVKRARAEIAMVTARCCKHGVDRTRGRCADCEKTTTPTETEETE